MEKPKHPLHLKYPELQKSGAVITAVEKKERLDDQRIPNDPRERLEAYIDRLENILLNKDERVRERNIEVLREEIYDAFIIKRENVPDSYFELQQRVARERGEEVQEIPPQVRERMIDTVVEDQKASLDRWIHYLQSDDAMYPPWFKYLVFRNVVNLSQFDKTLGKFKSRTQHTVAPFPDIYHEPLAQISDIYVAVDKDKAALKDPAIRQSFEKKFPTLYAELVSKSLGAQIEGKEEIKGEWMKFSQNNAEDAKRLFESLQGKGTGWCTAGRSTAEAQIESGDFYAYYTYDREDKPTQPRIAIRMQGQDRIAEVRGILEHQSLEPQMHEILDTKLNEFGDEADAFRKKSADMKRLTELDNKVKASESLNKEELVFLYEIKSPIESFGYGKDPRIMELRTGRNVREDTSRIFDCNSSEVAQSIEQVDASSKVYIGPLGPEIFKKFPLKNLKNLYLEFPNNKIRYADVNQGLGVPQIIADVAVSAKRHASYFTQRDIEQKIKQANLFRTSLIKHIKLIPLTLKELGFRKGVNIESIVKRAEDYGLRICTGEVLVQSYLQDEKIWGAYGNDSLNFSRRRSDVRLYGGQLSVVEALVWARDQYLQSILTTRYDIVAKSMQLPAIIEANRIYSRGKATDNYELNSEFIFYLEDRE